MANKNLSNLTTYQQVIKLRLEAGTPDSHQDSGQQLKEFLTRELNSVTKKIENLKMGGK